MSLKERVRHWLQIPAAAPAAPPQQRAVTGLSVTPGGRQSVDDASLAYISKLTYLAPFSADERWRKLQLDRFALDQISTADLIELLTEVSPDVSKALWDFLRLCNPGHTVKALMPGPEETEHPAGTAFLEAFLKQLGELYGSVNVPINRLFVAAFMRGAFCAELVMDASGRMPLDLGVPDPRWIYFQVILDPLRGPVWQPFQWIYGEKVVLDRPTFRYVPVDPLPGKPTGRALCSPAIFTCLFVIGLLHDLRRVVSQQGYPRLDLSVSLEELLKAMPADLMGDPDRTAAWLEDVVRRIGDAYNRLEPDDAYVHTDVVSVNRPVGTVDASSLGAIDGILRALDRQLVRALKTVPFLMGSNEAVSETHANRAYEHHLASIESLQQLCEGLLEHMLDRALQAAGIPATSQFRFDLSRRSEAMRDEQVKKLKIGNAATAYARGWLSQDEACKLAIDKETADQPEPRIDTAGIGGGGAPPMDNQPMPGINRGVAVRSGQADAIAFQAASERLYEEFLSHPAGNGKEEH